MIRKISHLPVILSGLLLFYGCGQKEDTIKPVNRTVIEAVYAAATLTPVEESELLAMSEGVMSRILVSEGDEVKAGQLLFEIRSVTQEARLAAATNALALARKQTSSQSTLLAESVAQLENARARFVNDSVQWERFKNLSLQQIGAKADFDKVSLAYTTSRNEYRNAGTRYERLKEQLRLELAQAESNYAAASEELRNYQVKADRDGFVYELLKETGDVVRRGELLAVLGSGEAAYLQLKVDEGDIRLVKVGQKVMVKLDIMPDSIFKAVVTKVYPRLNRREQAFRVDARFENEPALKLSGLNGEANIIINRRENVWAVPKAFLKNDSIWVYEAGEAVRRKIVTGVSDREWAEVISGLDSNSLILEK